MAVGGAREANGRYVPLKVCDLSSPLSRSRWRWDVRLDTSRPRCADRHVFSFPIICLIHFCTKKTVSKLCLRVAPHSRA